MTVDADFAALNPRQQQAVAHRGGSVLILAGAGAGKTRVLTSRIAWLAARGECAPENILAVTFTNKAAGEMRARAAATLGDDPRRLTLGTFHGVCHRLLRRHAARAGWDSNFVILDSQDQLSFVRRLLREAGWSDEIDAVDARAFVNAHKEEAARAADLPPAAGPRLQKLAQFYALYEEKSRAEAKVDFAELLLAGVELLRADGELRAHYARRFRHILIDEFQDTNRLQYDFLRLLDSGENAFFAVGDDDQSIYGFRGAQPENMRRFLRDYKVRDEDVVRLEENYRSTTPILDAANALIGQNRGRLGKNLRGQIGDGKPIAARIFADDETEARAVAAEIAALRDGGARLSEIAALYRLNAQSRQIEQQMLAAGLPYRVYGGLRFFDRAEIKRALAYMRLVAGDDDDAFLRAINYPPRGIGETRIGQLRARAAEAGGWGAAVAESADPKVRRFAALLRELRQTRAAGLEQIARACAEKSGLIAHYESRTVDKERADNLRELIRAAADFSRAPTASEEEEEGDSLIRFLANAALESSLDQNADKDAANGGGAVNLMTVHAAKGLEFERVYVVGLEEGIFPAGRSVAEGRSAIEEERRLMYVAITRAKRELTLTRALRRTLYGQSARNPSSRFLDEIPSELLAIDPADETEIARADAGGGDNWGRRPARDWRARRGDDGGAPKPQAGDFAPRGRPATTDINGKPLCIGEQARHHKYGVGVLVRLEGAGDSAQVSLAFKKHNIKTFSAKLVRLEKV